ncbi:MAG: hypothetical protein DRJ62_03060 [Thermoprotei archaeon]|nr:MAG: hypothetical protein DRJ62_03060 [Thermoprotei archaeon]
MLKYNITPFSAYSKVVWLASQGDSLAYVDVTIRIYFTLLLVLAGLMFLGLMSVNVPTDHPLYHAYSEMAAEYGITLDINSGDAVARQTMAVSIFAAITLGTLMFWRFRLAIALIGISMILAFGIAPLEMVIRFMGIDIIVFLMGMFIVIEYMRRTGALRYVMIKTLKSFGSRPWLLLVVILLLSMAMSALVGEVASIVFITSLILDISALMGLNPIPLVILSVFATNIGSTATVLGNPIGVYVAVRAGLTFVDFIRWSLPIALVNMLVIMAIAWLWLKKRLEAKASELDKDKLASTVLEMEKELDMGLVKKGWTLFALLIAFISLHGVFEGLLGLAPDTLLIAVPLVFAGAVLLIERGRAREYVEHGVDWWTLSFFMFLFSAAACLEFTGVTYKLAYVIESVAGSGITVTTTIIVLTVLTWITAVLSGFVDNMPIIAAMLPVSKALYQIGLPGSYSLWWGLVQGGCLGGNLTMVGSTANIVALGVLERARGITVSFKEWFKVGLLTVVATLVVAELLLIVQFPLMP